jgi:hypothetical protein
MFGFLRRRRPINDPEELAIFIDENAAFLTQRGIYEYSRARAGHYAKVLFAESGFHQAVETSRWRAYPLGLAMIAEVVEGVLHSRGGGDRRIWLDAVTTATLAAFDRYPPPATLGAETWQTLRVDLMRRLQLIGLHPVKRAMDVPEQFAKSYFDLMPIHEKLRGRDFPTLRNYLQVTLCNIHDELSERIDAPAVAAKLSYAVRA